MDSCAYNSLRRGNNGNNRREIVFSPQKFWKGPQLKRTPKEREETRKNAELPLGLLRGKEGDEME